jgi:hypothetical protein
MATPADDLKDLVGVKGGSAEGDLESRGYTHVDTNKSSTAAYSYWWSNAKSSCIRVTTRDGHWQTLIDVDPSDCGQTKKESGMSDDAKVAIGAAALLGIAALAHKSHHRDDRRYDEQQTADFERGYRDGLYNNSFHNYSNSSEYNDGYNRGVEERDQNSGYRHNNWSRGDYASNSNWGGAATRRAGTAAHAKVIAAISAAARRCATVLQGASTTATPGAACGATTTALAAIPTRTAPRAAKSGAEEGGFGARPLAQSVDKLVSLRTLRSRTIAQMKLGRTIRMGIVQVQP